MNLLLISVWSRSATMTLIVFAFVPELPAPKINAKMEKKTTGMTNVMMNAALSRRRLSAPILKIVEIMSREAPFP